MRSRMGPAEGGPAWSRSRQDAGSSSPSSISCCGSRGVLLAALLVLMLTPSALLLTRRSAAGNDPPALPGGVREALARESMIRGQVELEHRRHAEGKHPEHGDRVNTQPSRGKESAQMSGGTRSVANTISSANKEELAKPRSSHDTSSELGLSDSFRDIVKERRKMYEAERERLRQQSAANMKVEGCLHTSQRDYRKDPIRSPRAGPEGGLAKACLRGVPCTEAMGSGADIGQHAKGSKEGHVKHLTHSMENMHRGQHKLEAAQRNDVDRGDQIHAGPHTNSDVYLQYGSWAEYNYMRKPLPVKERTGGLVALISNCGPKLRLEWLQTIMDSKLIDVQSGGSCLKTHTIKTPSFGGRLKSKLDTIRPYKFVMAFENSQAVGYVTEKLFGPLVAGVIPIYWGAPDAKMYEPSRKSVIWKDDFKDATELAKYLHYLDNNDTAFMEYLEWKNTGPSARFIASLDESLEHSACRICTRAADLDRKFVAGPVEVGDPFLGENKRADEKEEATGLFLLRVRPRHEFWFRHLYVDSLRLHALEHAVRSSFNMTKHGEIVDIYRIWDRERRRLEPASMAQLAYGEELEVVFSNPFEYRPGYSEWKAGKPLDVNDFV